ncbi:reverse transcriptase domain-containing protein [Tanacetum coccineum]|uniref:Reverse transcriptase domain-containing protein n=1 Tax=Tanacetum coccineum TaxID=301880 RepID=A0ABQ5CZ21_9ASTR
MLNERSSDLKEVNTIIEEEDDNWMTSIIKCLEEGIWPEDKNEARCLRLKINQYVMKDGVLFRRSYMLPMLRFGLPRIIVTDNGTQFMNDLFKSWVEEEGKLRPKWEGPYRVTELYQNGSYKLQTMEDKEVEGTEGPARAAEMVGPEGAVTRAGLGFLSDKASKPSVFFETARISSSVRATLRDGYHRKEKFMNAIKLFNFCLPQSYKKILSLLDLFSALLLGNDKFRVLLRKLFLKLLNLVACQLELMPPTKVKPSSFKGDGVGQGIAFLLSSRKSKMNHHLSTPHQRVNPASSGKRPLGREAPPALDSSTKTCSRLVCRIHQRTHEKKREQLQFQQLEYLDDQGEDDNGKGAHQLDHPRNPKDPKVISRFSVEFCGGEKDERELLKMGEVGVVLFGGGKEEDMRILRRSEGFRREDVIEMEKNGVHI